MKKSSILSSPISTSNKEEKFTNELLEMPLNKIREKVLEEHEKGLEKEFKFADAVDVRKRVEHLKELEEEKTKAELQQIHDNELFALENEKGDEFKLFNEQYDAILYELTQRFDEMGLQMDDLQKSELDNTVKTFNDTYPEPKNSPEILDLYKKLDGIVKRKDYKKADEIYAKITELTNIQNDKWYGEQKAKKLQSELNKLRMKHENEVNALNLKRELAFNEFNAKRKTEEDKIDQKYKNRQKDLKNIQKNQMNELHGASKKIVIKQDKYTKTNYSPKKRSIQFSIVNGGICNNTNFTQLSRPSGPSRPASRPSRPLTRPFSHSLK